MIFFILLVTLLGTFVIVELIFTLSPNSIVIALVAVLVLWVVLRSYRKWASDKSEEDAEADNTSGTISHSSSLWNVSNETLFHKD